MEGFKFINSRTVKVHVLLISEWLQSPILLTALINEDFKLNCNFTCWELNSIDEEVRVILIRQI
jgi:hypothetical protein